MTERERLVAALRKVSGIICAKGDCAACNGMVNELCAHGLRFAPEGQQAGLQTVLANLRAAQMHADSAFQDVTTDEPDSLGRPVPTRPRSEIVSDEVAEVAEALALAQDLLAKVRGELERFASEGKAPQCCMCGTELNPKAAPMICEPRGAVGEETTDQAEDPMTNPLQARLAAMQERCERALPAPWKAEGCGIFTAPNGVGRTSFVAQTQNWQNGEEDADFIANARTDLPALLDLCATAIAAVPESPGFMDEVAVSCYACGEPRYYFSGVEKIAHKLDCSWAAYRAAKARFVGEGT